jgi:hypothetical protein
MRTRRASTLFRDDYNFGRTDRFSFAFLMLPARSFWKRAGPRRRAPENVELAVADQPVLRVGNDNLSFGQGHRAEISELWRIADRVRLEHIAMLCTREAVDMVVPDVLKIRKTLHGAPIGKIGDGIIALDREDDILRAGR